MMYSAYGNHYDSYPDDEGVVARALETQLPDWQHVHSRHLINREHGIGRPKGGYGEGEADFVCVVPDWGFLVVECKAHSQVRIEQGVWEYLGRRGWEPFVKGRRFVPPIRQAWGNMHKVRDCLTKALGPEYVSRIRSGYAVCFPNLDMHLQFERESDHQRWGIDGTFLPFTFDRAWMPKLGESLKRLVASLPAGAGCETDALLRCLAPTLDFLAPTQDRIFRIGQDLAVLTERQFGAVGGALAGLRRRHLVSGLAGTGKTVVARRIASSLAERGEGPIHLLCFSKNLAIENREALGGTGVLCDTVHGYFTELCRRSSIQLPSEFDQDFFDRGFARHVYQACTSQGVPRSQVCIVDECQDLTAENLAAISYLAPLKLVLLGDLQQSIFGEGAADRFTEFNAYTLTQNCRNPREIAGCVCVAAAIQPENIGVSRCPCAERWPRVLPVDTDEVRTTQTFERVLEDWMTLDGLPSSRIAVLTARRPEETPLGRQVSRISWINFTSDYRVWKRESNAVYLGTVHGFKGLDADAIFLHDMPSPAADEDRFGAAHTYVGISRPAFDLVVQPRDRKALDWFKECFEKGARCADLGRT